LQPRELELARIALHLRRQTDALLKGVLGSNVREAEVAFQAAVRGNEQLEAREEAILRFIVRLLEKKDALYDTVAWSVLNDVATIQGGRHVLVEVGQYELMYNRVVRAGVEATMSQVVTERQATFYFLFLLRRSDLTVFHLG
jgi:hypothetical protein